MVHALSHRNADEALEEAECRGPRGDGARRL